ncbi:MAG: hypothetical protein KI786_11835, partial [Mameliella sp.]|nr:hypothetical protein [Phaeodactylibacter sp.]
AWKDTHGQFTANPADVGLAGEPIKIVAGADYFLAIYELGNLKLRIREDGKIDHIQPKKTNE